VVSIINRLKNTVVYRVLAKAGDGWLKDDVPRLAAALAYYAMFSIAPLLMLATSIAGAVFSKEAVRVEIDKHLMTTVGSGAAATIDSMIASAAHPQNSMWAAIIGITTLVFGATSLFTELTASLNLIWNGSTPEPSKRISGLRHLVQVRLLSLGMVLMIGFLLMLSLVLGTLFHALHYWLEGVLELPVDVWALAGLGSSALLEVILFAIVFRGLTHVKFPWKDVLAGALFTGVLFEAGKVGLSWYLGRESFTSSYGAAGSLMVFLMWVYYSAIILLSGAEITEAWSQVRRERAAAKELRSTQEEICGGDNMAVKGVTKT
jgi:membrane protein